MRAQEIIRAKREGGALSEAQIQSLVRGLVDGSWSEGQIAALAMAVLWRGMSRAECVALTLSMRDSGRQMHWRDLPGPVLDKHSSGGVGDKISLMLAPLVAACGGFVPMISGRGLGHTGGTLDKLEAIPGFCAMPEAARFERIVREVGCAIIGQTADLAPADGRFYAVRDISATVESVPLITASILSKKLAAGLQGLVMDVKCGNGAFAETATMAQDLAESIVGVAGDAGLPARALITDMNAVLGQTVGNSLELREALSFLRGEAREPRLHALTLALAGEMLQLGGLAASAADAEARLLRALDSGAAAERFAQMVAAQGGPADLLERPELHLPAAPVQRPVCAPQAGRLSAMQTREIGLAVVELGGGRRRAGDRIDGRVGLSAVLPLGSLLQAGQPLAWVHAVDSASAERAAAAVLAACRFSEPELPWQAAALIQARVG